MNEKLKCLIIDDDPLIGDLLKHFCQKSDLVEYSILTSNATDALTSVSYTHLDVYKRQAAP